MPKKTIQDILPYVQNPSRYLGTEFNRVTKDKGHKGLKMALAFPDLYDIGTSHFGIQILYHLLNQSSDILVERIFAPATDMEAELRKNDVALPSLETERPMGDFDIVGFSLLYELNYTNVINMLDMGKIPLRWKSRTEDHPIIIAGGPSVCNPEPMADFFDVMVFGDGENVIVEMAHIWNQWKSAGGEDRNRLLQQWAQLESVYIPRFFNVRYDDDGFQHLTPDQDQAPTIQRAIVADLDQAFFPDRPVIPFGRPIHDRLRLELSRGCSRGCRFCQAGMIYRPVRERSPQQVLDLIEEALANTGYEDLSLLSLSTGDYSCLSGLMEALMVSCQEDRVAVSLPSLRAGSLTPRLMDLIRSVRKTGFTIAPEAGSQRLRDVVNKNITFDDVKATVENAFELGWRVIKLYFMIGLPTETEEDLDAIVEMVQRLKKIKGPKGRKGKINVSITTFVPKAHTPFQWAPQISLESSRQKITYLKQRLKMPGVQVKWQKPEMSMLEGILARGDRRLGKLIEQAVVNGCTFDGWNDHFDFQQWQRAMEQCETDPGFYTTRDRAMEEPLPWQHMDAKVDSGFLKDQWRAAMAGEIVEDCRHGDCHACGVCDFESVEPRVFENFSPRPADPVTPEETDGDHYAWLSLVYTKRGQARFFGQLEISLMFARAIRRARIKVQYSKGYHPMPKISFDDPLPLGIESDGEFMRIMVSIRHGCAEIVPLLNDHLPSGLRIVECRPRSQHKKMVANLGQRFMIQLDQNEFDAGVLSDFNHCDGWPYVRTNRKGSEHHIDLKEAIEQIILEGSHTLIYDISPASRFTIRPADILAGIFDMPTDLLLGAKVVKLDPRPEKAG